MSTKKDAVFVYSDEQLAYRFNDKHPFNHLRLQLTYDLLKELKALDDDVILAPRIATQEEIALVHDEAFIEAVKSAGKGTLNEAIAANYGLGTEDTPIFPFMHEAASLLVGGTLTAVDEVMSGRASHALHLAVACIMDLKEKLQDFVFITTAQLLLNT